MLNAQLTTRRPPPAGSALGLALLTYAVTVGSSMLPTRGAPTLLHCVASAGIAGAGCVLMAAILARHSSQPRRAALTAASVLAVMMLLTPLTAGSPGDWLTHVRPLVWMVPWFPLATAATGGGRSARASANPCCPTARVAAAVLIGQAVMLGAILLAIGPVSRLLTGHR